VAQRDLRLRAEQGDRRAQLVSGVRDEAAQSLDGLLDGCARQPCNPIAAGADQADRRDARGCKRLEDAAVLSLDRIGIGGRDRNER